MPFAFPDVYLESEKREPITQSVHSGVDHQFHPTDHRIVSNATLFSREETAYSIATVTYTRPFEPSPREIIHGDLSLSPRVCSEYEPPRLGGIGENHEKRTRANTSVVHASKRERRGSFSSLSLSDFNLANVLVVREVASVSVDLHLVQRAWEPLRGSFIRRSFACCLLADRRVPGSPCLCISFFPFFYFYFFFSLFSFPKADVTRSILVRTGACEVEL